MSDHGGVLAAPCPCGSMRPYAECHGGQQVPLVTRAVERGLDCVLPSRDLGVFIGASPQFQYKVTSAEATMASDAVPPITKPPVTRRLDLASGQNPRAGYEGVDLWAGAQHVVDLQSYPWPFEDESVLELNCSHYIEHIPMEYISPITGGPCSSGSPLAKDALFAFFDECWRILTVGGWLYVQVPAHRSDRAFQDPTHRRFITQVTFAYMSEQWRRDNGLDHYNVSCNFVGDAHPIIDKSLELRYPETAGIKMQKEWNSVIDWTAKLQKAARLPPR